MRQYTPRLQKGTFQRAVLHLSIRKVQQNDKDNSDTHRNLGQTLWTPVAGSQNLRPFQKAYPSGRWIAAFTFFCTSAAAVPHFRPRTENLTAQKRVAVVLKIKVRVLSYRISCSLDGYRLAHRWRNQYLYDTDSDGIRIITHHNIELPFIFIK